MTTVQAYLRAVVADDHQLLATGAFDVFVDPVSDHPYANYAIPRPDVEPDAEAAEELITLMEGAARIPRLEYLPAEAPAVEAVLADAGFEVQLRTPVMTCTPDELADLATPENVTLDQLGPNATREELEGLVRAQSEAFDEPFSSGSVERVARTLGRRIAVVAFADGEVAGAGMCQPVIDGTTELVGIGVREQYRRRGIATAVTAELARLAFESGATAAFMTPGDGGAQQAYENAGFSASDEMLHLIKA